MFKKSLISATLLILLIVLYIIYYCFYIFPQDIRRYENYLEGVQSKKAHQESSTEQHRTSVYKDIWHYDEGERLHYHIHAASSILTLVPYGNAFLLQEHLNQVDCAVQEKLYYNSQKQPFQKMSVFYADHGTYDFTHHHFSAHTVFLKFYTLPGHTLLLSNLQAPFLKGRARSVSLTLSHHGPTFHAEKFTAQMDLKEYDH